MTRARAPWRQAVYVLLVIGNIIAALWAGLLSLAVGIYGFGFLASIWPAPALLVLGPIRACLGADRLARGRWRQGVALMIAPILAGAALAAWHVLTISAGQRAYDALNAA